MADRESGSEADMCGRLLFKSQLRMMNLTTVGNGEFYSQVSKGKLGTSEKTLRGKVLVN